MGRGGGLDKVRECWPPVATVPEPVPSAGILGCSGSTWRPLRGTDRCCSRGAEIYSQSQMGRIIIDLKRCMIIFFCTANCIYLPCKVWVHHLHLVLQLALVCPQQLQSTTETQTRFTPWQLFTQSCSLVDHVTSALEAGDRVPIAGQRVALGLRKCSLEFVTLIIQYM